MIEGIREPYEPVRFIIIDDDDISLMAVKRSIKKLKIANPVTTAKDGVEAMEILHGLIGRDGKLPPCILTLDLNMPKMGGLEFLDKIRSNSTFSKLIVFVLTTSNTPSDIARAYEKNIAGYIVKGNETETLSVALELLNDYSQLVVLPS